MGVDGVVPTLATRRWVRTMPNMELAKNGTWHPWRTSDGELAGFMEHFVPRDQGAGKSAGEALFATVLGAGYMVPQFRARRAYELVRNFLNLYSEHSKIPREAFAHG